MIKKVEINLEPLYRYGVKLASERLLELILSQYEVDYKILFAASKDIDVKYYDYEFKEYVDKCLEKKEDTGEEDIKLNCAMQYAEEKCFETVVQLFDGYEEAVAIVRRKEEVSG